MDAVKALLTRSSFLCAASIGVGLLLTAALWVILAPPWQTPVHLRPDDVRLGKEKQGCVSMLWCVSVAKDGYLRDNPGSRGEEISLSLLQPYVAADVLQCTNCPSGGVLQVMALGEYPTCAIPEHQEAFLRMARGFEKK